MIRKITLKDDTNLRYRLKEIYNRSRRSGFEDFTVLIDPKYLHVTELTTNVLMVVIVEPERTERLTGSNANGVMAVPILFFLYQK